MVSSMNIWLDVFILVIKSARMKKVEKRVENKGVNFSKHMPCTLSTVVSDLHSLFLMMRWMLLYILCR